MVVSIPRRTPEQGWKDGPWWQPIMDTGTGLPSAEFCCPAGCPCFFSRKVHDISEDGTVHPSLVCPACPAGFHEFVRLEGWGFAAQPNA